jgi:RNA polymerase sigma factor (sigma-70 family)
MSPSVSARLLATQSDQRLLELVGKGYERAFEAIVHRYRRPLLGYCRRMGLSESRAEDVLQQSLLKAWLALQAGTSVRELRAWLYRIVHNTAVNAIRNAPEDRASVTEAPSQELAAAESELERRIAARQALSDVAALPPMQREAILLSAVDGRSHEEVASALGITNGAVRGLLYRARASLRAAAAVFVPGPLIDWASGGATRLGPTAARLAELSGSGGGDAGSALLKGVAVAVAGAVAAGAVIGPLHRQRAPAHRGSVLPAARMGADALAPGAGGSSATPGTGQGALPAVQRSHAAPGSGVPSRSVLRLTPNGSRHRGRSPLTQPAVLLTSPRATQIGARSDGGSGSRPSDDGSSDGSSAPAAGSPPPPSGSTQGGSDGGDGGQSGSEAEHQQAEREAEEAREARERTAEAAREQAEREAEEAREHEATAAQAEPIKDS